MLPLLSSKTSSMVKSPSFISTSVLCFSLSCHSISLCCCFSNTFDFSVSSPCFASSWGFKLSVLLLGWSTFFHLTWYFSTRTEICFGVLFHSGCADSASKLDICRTAGTMPTCTRCIFCCHVTVRKTNSKICSDVRFGIRCSGFPSTCHFHPRWTFM